MKKILFTALSISVILSVSGCGWTEPEPLDYYRTPVEDRNPEEYARYLEALRNYKASDHKVAILTMEGTSQFPVLQSQHIMAMPDSADYICMTNTADLHPAISEEIQEVKVSKGTCVLSSADFEKAYADWLLYKNQCSDAGKPAPTIEECRAFFKSHAERQLADCDKYGFEGILFSFNTALVTEDDIAASESFMQTVKEWKKQHEGKLCIIRGIIKNIDPEFWQLSKYHIIVLGGNSGAVSYKSLVRANMRDVEPRDRVVFEVTVPSTEKPEQAGDSPVEAAEVIFDEQMQGQDFISAGIAVENAHDDYFTSGMSFANIRPAIALMSEKENTNSNEDEK